MTDEALVADLERRLDAEYAACLPTDAGWEPVALHLLLLFDWLAAEECDGRQLDAMKYPLMHALRWGVAAPSRPFTSRPAYIDIALLGRCQEAFSRANEYVGICGAFIRYHRRIDEVRELQPGRIAFASNAEWQAFEMLSESLSEHRTLGEAGLAAAAEIGQVAESSLAHPESDENVTPTTVLDETTLHELIRRTRSVTSLGYELPDDWNLDGLGIAYLRRFWDALQFWATFHLARAALMPDGLGLSRLMIHPRSEWIECLVRTSQLEAATVSHLLDDLCYSRRARVPDIAIAPLLDIGGSHIAASPYLLLSSAMERNFCAKLARDDTRYHRTTEPLHRLMAAQISAEFENAGFRCRADVPIETPLGNTAIDLLIWSPEERFVAAVELKWVIAVGDVMEVFNRGDAAARQALDRQLPKYANALAAEAGEIVRRAFGLPAAPPIDDNRCGLILRGHVGSSLTRRPDVFTLPEPLLADFLAADRSLKGVCEKALEMRFLPLVGRDFISQHLVVRSPSGIEVEFCEPVPIPEVDGANR